MTCKSGGTIAARRADACELEKLGSAPVYRQRAEWIERNQYLARVSVDLIVCKPQLGVFKHRGLIKVNERAMVVRRETLLIGWEYVVLRRVEGFLWSIRCPPHGDSSTILLHICHRSRYEWLL